MAQSSSHLSQSDPNCVFVLLSDCHRQLDNCVNLFRKSSVIEKVSHAQSIKCEPTLQYWHERAWTSTKPGRNLIRCRDAHRHREDALHWIKRFIFNDEPKLPRFWWTWIQLLVFVCSVPANTGRHLVRSTTWQWAGWELAGRGIGRCLIRI